MNIIISSLVLILGLAVGSFANVVIYRVPAGESIVKPRSKCPHCGHTLAWQENIPVLSYLLLRGRCSRCKEKISVRYPVIELLTGLAFVVVWLRIGLEPELPAFLIMAA
ncbi:MAG: prepilin peptidase, partial [Actinomycetota bacterium]